MAETVINLQKLETDMKTSKILFGLLLIVFTTGLVACSNDEDDGEVLNIDNLIEDSGTVGPLAVDYFLTDANGERTTSFSTGEDIVFNVVLTNASDTETADWGFVQDTFSVYGSDLRLSGSSGTNGWLL